MKIKLPPTLDKVLEAFKTLEMPPGSFAGINNSIIKSLKLENEEDVIDLAVHTGFLLGVICGRCCTKEEFEEFRKEMMQLAIDIKPPQPGVNQNETVDLDVATRLMNAT